MAMVARPVAQDFERLPTQAAQLQLELQTAASGGVLETLFADASELVLHEVATDSSELSVEAALAANHERLRQQSAKREPYRPAKKQHHQQQQQGDTEVEAEKDRDSAPSPPPSNDLQLLEALLSGTSSAQQSLESLAHAYGLPLALPAGSCDMSYDVTSEWGEGGSPSNPTMVVETVAAVETAAELQRGVLTAARVSESYSDPEQSSLHVAEEDTAMSIAECMQGLDLLDLDLQPSEHGKALRTVEVVAAAESLSAPQQRSSLLLFSSADADAGERKAEGEQDGLDLTLPTLGIDASARAPPKTVQAFAVDGGLTAL